MADWRFHVASLITGEVLDELPLVGVRLQRHLEGGEFEAGLNLAGLSRIRRRELLDVVRPGKVTIVAERNGQVAGEWVLWGRSRPSRPVPITLRGLELVTYPSTQMVPRMSFRQTDQMRIAHRLVTQGFWSDNVKGSRGSVAIDVPVPALSGRLRDRDYVRLSASIAQRLEELSNVIDGFEWGVTSEFVRTGGRRFVRRTARFHYPRAGTDTSLLFDQAAAHTRPTDGLTELAQGGAVVDFQFDEDASRLASVAYAIGAGEGSDQVVGFARDLRLVGEGYPRMMTSVSVTSVNRQSTADTHARAALAMAQNVETPPSITVRGEGDPALGDYELGDRVTVQLDPSQNMPDGYRRLVRILGWTVNPTDPGPELVELEVTDAAIQTVGLEDE